MAKKYQHNELGVVEIPELNNRQIYNNAMTFPLDSQSFVPGYAVRQNVRISKSRKKAKTSNVVGLLFITAAVALLYVGNVITVHNLAKEVDDLHTHYYHIISTNEVIKAEINRKASLERIGLMAQEKLALTNPKEAPQWFEVDHEKESDVAELLKKKRP